MKRLCRVVRTRISKKNEDHLPLCALKWNISDSRLPTMLFGRGRRHVPLAKQIIHSPGDVTFFPPL